MEWSTKNIAISIILTIATITLPTIYEDYSHRSELEFRIESSNSLFPADPLLMDFLITYQGRPIKNLTRMDCTFFNSGNTPIASNDIIEEPIINIPKKCGIIAVVPLNKYPENLYVEYPLNLSRNEIKLNFKLLNPGDYIKLAIYLNGSSTELPNVVARIKGVKEISVVNFAVEDKQTDKNPNIISKILLILKYGITFLIIVFILFSAKQSIDFHRTKRLLNKNPKLLSEYNNIEQFKKFIGKNLAGLGKDQKKKLLDAEIKNAEEDFSPENKNKLIAAINSALDTTSASETALLFFILLLVAIVYIYWPIL